MRQNASERRGTHMTKNRALVERQRQEALQAEGHRPRRRSDRRARRCGGTAARCSGRSRAATTTRCRRRSSAARCARRSRRSCRTARSWSSTSCGATEKKTKAGGRAAEAPGRDAARRSSSTCSSTRTSSASARNIAGVRLVASGRLTARDVMDTARIIATRAAVERLQEVLG